MVADDDGRLARRNSIATDGDLGIVEAGEYTLNKQPDGRSDGGGDVVDESRGQSFERQEK